MATRKEWTEWHLTPRGWERGATRVQGKGNTWVDDPEDRVVSFVYQELETAVSPEVRRSSEETWRSKEVPDAEVDRMVRGHGGCPQKL
jgi:hypothetical protein